MDRGIEAVHKFSGRMILADSIEDIYKSALSVTLEAIKTESCSAYAVRDGIPEVVSQHGDSAGMPEKILKAGKSIFGESEAYVPVMVDGRVEGFISLRSSNALVEDDKHLLETIAGMTEIALKNLEQKKKASENRYRNVIENAAEGIYLSTVDGHIIEANHSLVKFFGYESKKELEKAGIVTTYKNPSDREKFIKKILNDGEVRNYEIEYRKKNGETVIGNEFATLVDGGSTIEGIIHDITELKKAQKEAEFYNSLLRHDIWNKNQVMMGYLDLLSDTGLSVEQKNFLERAKLAVKSIMELTMGVKKLNLLEKNQELKEMDVDEMIDGITNQLLHEAEMRGISIYYVPSHVKVNATALIKEVFYNILFNAIIHSRCKNISIHAEQEDGFCKISIEDDGIGIDPEIKADIFKKTVKGGRGNGMGLYLSGKIAEMSGGVIKIRNGTDGKGTVFDVYLPIENGFKR